MRIIVMSDSHGNYSAVEEIIQRNQTADMFIHLGDGEREVDRALTKFPHINVYHVKGNCDFASLSPSILELPVGYGHKIIAVHGHNQGVNYSLEHLKKTALENNADIVLYGHTHMRDNRYENGLYILNPGSASSPRDNFPPSFALIDVSEKGILINIADVK